MKNVIGFGLALWISMGWSVPSYADRPHFDYTTVTKIDNQTDAQTDATLWTPTSGYRLVIQGIYLIADTTQTVFFEVGSTTKIPVQYLIAGVPSTVSLGGRPILTLAADEALTYTSTTGANTSVIVVGYEDRF